MTKTVPIGHLPRSHAMLAALMLGAIEKTCRENVLNGLIEVAGGRCKVVDVERFCTHVIGAFQESGVAITVDGDILLFGDDGSGRVSEKEKALLAEIIAKVNELFEGEVTDEDKLVYVNQVIRTKLLASPTLQKQAANNTKEQFATSPDLGSELLNAIMSSLDAHTTMSTQALNSAHGSALDPGVADTLSRSAAESAKRQEDLGHPACLLVPDMIRAPMARLLKRAAPRLRVLSHSEIPETHSIRIGSIIGSNP